MDGQNRGDCLEPCILSCATLAKKNIFQDYGMTYCTYKTKCWDVRMQHVII